MIAIYLSAFSSSAAIKLFLEMPIFLEIICLKCPPKKTREGKIQKLVETWEFRPRLI
jgi:hypothetical protein